ncbi:MAG: hypothetical protein WCS28_09845 [Thiomicrospira sp.]
MKPLILEMVYANDKLICCEYGSLLIFPQQRESDADFLSRAKALADELNPETVGKGAFTYEVK